MRKYTVGLSDYNISTDFINTHENFENQWEKISMLLTLC